MRRLLLAALAVCACAPRPAPPSADTTQSPFPQIGGRAVMLLPVQSVVPLIGRTAADSGVAEPLSGSMREALDAELAYWLPENAPRAGWKLQDAVVRASRSSAAVRVDPYGLPVQDFLRSRLESIGDPLYGELRGLGALLDARLALLPVGAVWIGEPGGSGRVHIAVALIDTMGGAVVWYGVVAGSPGAREDPATAASAARALAQRVAGQ